MCVGDCGVGVCVKSKLVHHCCFSFTDIIISDPLFHGDTSFMAFTRNMDVKFSTRVTIEFKPRGDTGILFYVANQLHHHSGDFLSVSLSKGIVEFRFSLGE